MQSQSAGEQKQQPVVIEPQPIVKIERPKPEGISYRTTYEIIVEDVRKAVLWCIENKYFECLDLKVNEIRKRIIESEGNITIPGIKYTKVNVPVIRK